MASEKQLRNKINTDAQRVLASIKELLDVMRITENMIESINEHCKTVRQEEIRKNSDEQHRLEFEVFCYTIFLTTKQTRKYLVPKGIFSKETEEELCGFFDGALTYQSMISCRTEFQDTMVEQLDKYQAIENKETGGSLQLFGILIARAATRDMQKRLNAYTGASIAGEGVVLTIGEIAMRAMEKELKHPHLDT